MKVEENAQVRAQENRAQMKKAQEARQEQTRAIERKQQESRVEQRQQAARKELQRSFEVQSEPPLTVLKFTNPETKEIEMQVPSEAQIKTYQNMQDYLKKQER